MVVLGVVGLAVVSGSCGVGGVNRDSNDVPLKQLILTNYHQQRITLADDALLQVARGESAKARGLYFEQLRVAAPNSSQESSQRIDDTQYEPSIAPTISTAVWQKVDYDFSATVFSCIGDGTGAYACTPNVAAGACGYVLNPGDTGPGVDGPSLYVACGPSWPCGTTFILETGQYVICADRGNPYYVHDRHFDAWCYNAANRPTCLPGIESTVRVVAVKLPVLP